MNLNPTGQYFGQGGTTALNPPNNNGSITTPTTPTPPTTPTTPPTNATTNPSSTTPQGGTNTPTTSSTSGSSTSPGSSNSNGSGNVTNTTPVNPTDTSWLGSGVAYLPTYTSGGYILYTKAGSKDGPSYAKDKDGNKISIADLKAKLGGDISGLKKIAKNAYNTQFGSTGGASGGATSQTAGPATNTSSINPPPKTTAAVTGDKNADAAANQLKSYNDSLNQWMAGNLETNLQGRTDAINRIDDANLRQQTLDRITQVNNGFKNASTILSNASNLASKATAIYSNENIRAMREKLISQGRNPAKAGPAVLAKAMKDKAGLSANVMNVQAEYNKSLANLEAQRTQLEDTVRASGIENDKWVIDKKNEIQQQIQNLRTNFEQAVIQNTDKYVMKPVMDVFSGNFEAELQNIARKKELEFANSSPEAKIYQAAKMFGSDWAYVSDNIASQANSMTFGQLLVAAGNSIKNNKIAAQKAVK